MTTSDAVPIASQYLVVGFEQDRIQPGPVMMTKVSFNTLGAARNYTAAVHQAYKAKPARLCKEGEPSYEELVEMLGLLTQAYNDIDIIVDSFNFSDTITIAERKQQRESNAVHTQAVTLYLKALEASR